MAMFIVGVSGKLIVQAEDKKAAVARANVFMADKGVPSFKGNEFGTEMVENSQVITEPTWTAVG